MNIQFCDDQECTQGMVNHENDEHFSLGPIILNRAKGFMN